MKQQPNNLTKAQKNVMSMRNKITFPKEFKQLHELTKEFNKVQHHSFDTIYKNFETILDSYLESYIKIYDTHQTSHKSNDMKIAKMFCHEFAQALNTLKENYLLQKQNHPPMILYKNLSPIYNKLLTLNLDKINSLILESILGLYSENITHFLENDTDKSDTDKSDTDKSENITHVSENDRNKNLMLQILHKILPKILPLIQVQSIDTISKSFIICKYLDISIDLQKYDAVIEFYKSILPHAEDIFQNSKEINHYLYIFKQCSKAILLLRNKEYINQTIDILKRCIERDISNILNGDAHSILLELSKKDLNTSHIHIAQDGLNKMNSKSDNSLKSMLLINKAIATLSGDTDHNTLQTIIKDMEQALSFFHNINIIDHNSKCYIIDINILLSRVYVEVNNFDKARECISLLEKHSSQYDFGDYKEFIKNAEILYNSMDSKANANAKAFDTVDEVKSNNTQPLLQTEIEDNNKSEILCYNEDYDIIDPKDIHEYYQELKKATCRDFVTRISDKFYKNLKVTKTEESGKTYYTPYVGELKGVKTYAFINNTLEDELSRAGVEDHAKKMLSKGLVARIGTKNQTGLKPLGKDKPVELKFGKESFRGIAKLMHKCKDNDNVQILEFSKLLAHDEVSKYVQKHSLEVVYDITLSGENECIEVQIFS